MAWLSDLPIIFFLLAVSSCLHRGETFSTNCLRTPASSVSEKTPGDGGYKIEISGNPEKYVPGEVYTVSIKGKRSQFSVQKFTGLMLMVESSSPTAYIYGPQSVGTFQLYGDALTRHSEDCPNAVVQTSNIVKSEVQVLWTAPPAGSGCVKFKATVSEGKGVWYMDDGELSKLLCEEVQDSDDRQPEIISECCACDEAKYEVTFEGLWSRQTHPKYFPPNEWLTHFSDIIGASHSNDYRMWEYGGLASDGLRQVAEWGSTGRMESELKRQSDHIRTIIKARGLWFPDVNKKTFAVFRVDNRHHLMSLVSMLGPSPDWIVGVSALELCIPNNCSWVESKTLKLYPWDAGTDSGVTYMASNSPTIPREKIRRITNSYPNNPKSPFYEPKGLPMKPLAKLTISRQRVYKKSCSDGPSTIDDYDSLPAVDVAEDRPECAVSEWGPFSACSVTCGKGIRTATRYYRNPMKANMLRCSVQLEKNEMCPGREPFCEGGDSDEFFRKMDDPICQTTEWSRWNSCSATCGMGVRMRFRKYLNRMARKRCDKELSEKKTCQADVRECPIASLQNENSACKVTEWTMWSPCSVTCGNGFRVRKRFFLVPYEEQKSCNVKEMDKEICSGEKPTCDIDASMAKEVCLLEKDTGPCRGNFPRFYYDKDKRVCIHFTYGGCRGNRNNFEAYDECTRICEFSRDTLHGNRYGSYARNDPQEKQFGNQNIYQDLYGAPEQNSGSEYDGDRGFLTAENQLAPRVDCQYSSWSDWSQCSVTCGRGWRERKRTIQVEAVNGGKPCSKKTVRRRKCKFVKCPQPAHHLESMSFVYEPYLEYSSGIAGFSNDMKTYMAKSHKNQKSLDQQFGIEDSNVTEDCVMSDWGPWSPCTHSCGSESLQQRARSIIVTAKGGGKPCGPRLERRYCTLPPCPHLPHERYCKHGNYQS